MKNKLEINYIVDAEGKGYCRVNVHATGLEAKTLTLGLLDHMANAFTKTPIEKIVFLKSIHNEMGKLILKTWRG